MYEPQCRHPSGVLHQRSPPTAFADYSSAESRIVKYSLPVSVAGYGTGNSSANSIKQIRQPDHGQIRPVLVSEEQAKEAPDFCQYDFHRAILTKKAPN